jgi:hypothetical protein
MQQKKELSIGEILFDISIDIKIERFWYLNEAIRTYCYIVMSMSM